MYFFFVENPLKNCQDDISKILLKNQYLWVNRIINVLQHKVINQNE